MRDGDSYLLIFGWINSVVLGVATLEETKTLNVHENIVVDVLLCERSLQLGILSHLSKIIHLVSRSPSEIPYRWSKFQKFDI